MLEDMKNKGCLIAKGKKKGKMFTLDADMPELSAAMFAHGTGVVANIDIWHKRIGPKYCCRKRWKRPTLAKYC